jgi:protein CpxP
MAMETKMGLKAAALLCAGLLAVVPAMAQADAPPPPPAGGGQGQGPGRGNPERRLEMMTTQLNLSPDQVAKVKAIQAEGREKMMALRNDSAVSQDDRREKMTGLMKTENEKIKAVLNEDQRKKFAEMQEKNRERMRDGGGRPGGGTPATPPPAA